MRARRPGERTNHQDARPDPVPPPCACRLTPEHREVWEKQESRKTGNEEIKKNADHHAPRGSGGFSRRPRHASNKKKYPQISQIAQIRTAVRD